MKGKKMIGFLCREKGKERKRIKREEERDIF